MTLAIVVNRTLFLWRSRIEAKRIRHLRSALFCGEILHQTTGVHRRRDKSSALHISFSCRKYEQTVADAICALDVDHCNGCAGIAPRPLGLPAQKA